jgi:hypothetical protein
MYPSLNVEYILYRIYELLTNIPVHPGVLPSFALFLIEAVAVMGTLLSFVLIAMTVYVRVRLVQVEHHGFHVKEEAEHMQRHEEEHVAKNARWEMIVELSGSQNESDWRRAILEADIMLAAVLSERGYPGETLGEQLKNANPQQFTTINFAWEAHKMRNAIAHLGEAFPLTARDVNTTINNYQRVFEEFDYI